MIAEKYKTLKNELGHSGTGSSQKQDFRWYDQMDELFGHRPGYNMQGIDSSTSSVECPGTK